MSNIVYLKTRQRPQREDDPHQLEEDWNALAREAERLERESERLAELAEAQAREVERLNQKSGNGFWFIIGALLGAL